MTTGPVIQVAWDEMPSKSIEKYRKAICITTKTIKNWVLHFCGPWPGMGLDLSLLLACRGFIVLGRSDRPIRLAALANAAKAYT